MSMEDMTDKQKAARKLASDYSRYLFDQENLVERIVDRKWLELSSYIEELIDKKVQEAMNAMQHQWFLYFNQSHLPLWKKHY